MGRCWPGFGCSGRVGGCAADAVMVGSEIIRHDIGTRNNHRVGGGAANPTDKSGFALAALA